MCIPQARTFEDLMNRPGAGRLRQYEVAETKRIEADERQAAGWDDWSRLVREEGWR